MITAADLAWMRPDANLTLPDLCTIEKADRTRDSQGGQPLAYTPLATSVPVRIDRNIRGAREMETAGKVTSVSEFSLTLPASQVILPEYRVVITSLSNRTFEVIGLRAGSFEIVRVVDVEEVT